MIAPKVFDMNQEEANFTRPSGTAAHVLAIDDEPHNLTVIEAALAPYGYEIAVARDAKEGREVAHGRTPHLVLLDVMMPGESGIDVCRSWRQAAVLEYTPIVLVTALGADDHRTEGLLAGADDFIEKPFDIDALVDRVRWWLAIGRSPRLPAAALDRTASVRARVLAAAREIVPEPDAPALAQKMARAAGLEWIDQTS
ncbi:MAG: response regulator [Acidimicrobiia bacterium]|nr:response regulator [Acidimicrobiia bacterium]